MSKKILLMFLFSILFFLILSLLSEINKFTILVIPKYEESIVTNTSKLEEIKESLDFECYHAEKGTSNYCIFPEGDFKLLYPSGHSMLPFFEGQNEVLLCNKNFTLVESGIYSFNSSLTTIPIVHRCIQLTENGCLFKGDNNKFPENVTNDQIQCRVEFMIRKID